MDNAASIGNSFAEAATSGPLILGLLAAAVDRRVSQRLFSEEAQR